MSLISFSSTSHVSSEQYSLSHDLRFQYINHADAIRVAKIDDIKEMRDTQVHLERFNSNLIEIIRSMRWISWVYRKKINIIYSVYLLGYCILVMYNLVIRIIMLLSYPNEVCDFFLFSFDDGFVWIDLQAPCAYFGIQTEYLKTKLISKRLEFKEQEGMKQVDQTFTVDKAIFTRDALAKSTYARIFDYLIQVLQSS